VCELDLVFNFHKVCLAVPARLYVCFTFGQVYAILDEVFLAGEIIETSKLTVLGRLNDLEKLE